MRVFVYEWSCCVPDAPPSIRREGWAMLWAVLRDFHQTRQMDTVTLVHPHFPHLPPGEVHRVEPADEEERFRDLAASADATLVIAPETAEILLQRVRWVEEVGGRLLGPNSADVEIAGDKLRLDRRWRECGIPTPRMFAPDEPITYPVVVKPRDGAGSQATFLVHDAAELQRSFESAGPRDLLIQQYIPGLAASVGFLFGPGKVLTLSPAAQHLSADGRFQYEGGTVPLPPPLAARAALVARQAVDVLPSRGFVGVDIVLGDADGSADYAVEINPRLTTSYIGLSALCRDNLAVAMLRVALGQDVGNLRWRDEVIRFSPNGDLETRPAIR